MQRKCYIIVVTQALVVCLICPPSALGLRVYISGRPLVPVLQLSHKIILQVQLSYGLPLYIAFIPQLKALHYYLSIDYVLCIQLSCSP